MVVSKAQSKDLHAIMEIVRHAQAYLAFQKIEQWQNGYPDENRILVDINNDESYLVKNEAQQLLGIAMFSTRPEATYHFIEGNWLTDKAATYGVIHRMAVNENYRSRGFGKFVFNHFESLLQINKIKSMRIDTHQDNKLMQHLLHKSGYTFCGIISLENGDKRLAFEKVLDYSL